MSWNAFSRWDDEALAEETVAPDLRLRRVDTVLAEMRSGQRAGRESNTSQVIKDEFLVDVCGWPRRIEKLEAENESTNGVVDYLLRLPSAHVHLEVKRAGRELRDGYVSKYLRGRPEQPFEFGLLTNGSEWRLLARVRDLPSFGVVSLGSTSDINEAADFLQHRALSARLRKSLLASTPFTRTFCGSPASPHRGFAKAYGEHFDGKAPLLGTLAAELHSLENRVRRRLPGPRYSAATLMGVAAMRTRVAAEAFHDSFSSFVGLKRVGFPIITRAIQHAFVFPHEWEHQMNLG